jgi:hypothetical protein
MKSATNATSFFFVAAVGGFFLTVCAGRSKAACAPKCGARTDREVGERVAEEERAARERVIAPEAE